MRRTRGTGPIPQKLYLTERAIARLHAAVVGTPHNMSAIVDNLIMKHLPMTASEQASHVVIDESAKVTPDIYDKATEAIRGKRPGVRPAAKGYSFDG